MHHALKASYMWLNSAIVIVPPTQPNLEPAHCSTLLFASMIGAHPADSANEIDMCLSAIWTGTYALYMFWERDAATTPSTRSAGNKSKLVCSSS